MILPSMGNILIGMSFFEKYSVTLDLANNIVKFPEITLQLKPPNGAQGITENNYTAPTLDLCASHSRKEHRHSNRHC